MNSVNYGAAVWSLELKRSMTQITGECDIQAGRHQARDDDSEFPSRGPGRKQRNVRMGQLQSNNGQSLLVLRIRNLFLKFAALWQWRQTYKMATIGLAL